METGSGAVVWGLRVHNSGPALRDAILDIVSLEDEGSVSRHRLGEIAAEAEAWVYLGGPADVPPDTLFRLRATGLLGARIDFSARTRGLTRPPQLPGEVARHAGLPLAPGAGWHPQEIAVEVNHCSLVTGEVDRSPAASALAAAVDATLRESERVPSRGAAREVAWSCIRAVFGPEETAMAHESLVAPLTDLARAVRRRAAARLAAQLPPQRIPHDRLSLAVTSGVDASVYLVNPTDLPVQAHASTEGLVWQASPAAMEPVQSDLGTLPPRSAVRIALLAPRDDASSLECRVWIDSPRADLNGSFRAVFPGAVAGTAGEILDLLALAERGARVQPLRREIGPHEPLPQDSAGSDRRHAA
ncbi:MAG TPA: hypothetical protein VGC54_06835 [Planctomycetota bacterium]